MRPIALVVALAACSSSTKLVAQPPDASTDSGGAAEVQTDDGGTDAAIESGTNTSCVVQFTKVCPSDDEKGCDTFLSLPNGNEFCTLSCEKTADCPPGVVCNPNVGVCLPACTDNAPCKASGFVRCDTEGKTCTTL